MTDFSLDMNSISQFVTIADKCATDETLVMNCDGEEIEFFIRGEIFGVSWKVSTNSSPFTIFTNCKKMLSVLKKCPGGEVKFKVGKSSVKMKSGNSIFEFPLKTTSTCEKIVIGNGTEDVGGDFKSILDHMSGCDVSDSKLSMNMRGVLLDGEELAKMCGFKSSIIRIKNLRNVQFPRKRIVISSEAASVFDYVNSRFEVSSMFMSDRVTGLRTREGVMVEFSNVHDGFPMHYMKSLKLEGVFDDGKVLEGREEYSFNSSDLLSCIKDVSVVLDKEDSFLGMEIVGRDKNTSLPVWKVDCRSFDGHNAEGLVVSSSGNPDARKKFVVSRSDMVKVLESSGETIFIYDKDTEPLVIYDKEREDVVLLLKRS